MNVVTKFAVKKGTQLATKKFLDKEFEENKSKTPGGRWDPYFEYRPDRKGRMKKVKKQIPDYIPEHDAKILADVRKWAYRLDMKLSILGMRFGWSAVIGLIPELGDLIDVLFALMVYQKCKKIEGGLDKKTKAKMKAWIVTDGLVGLVPLIGDIIDAQVKCNARNCRLLEEFLDKKYKPELLLEAEKKRLAKDPNYKPPAPATVYEGSDEEHDYHHPREIEYGTTNGREHMQSFSSQRQASHKEPSRRRGFF